MSAENRSPVDDDDSVSMAEILDQESRMQEDASAVLGGCDDQQCTYSETEGYVKRQALYACSTCSTSGPAGICLACSYHCHEGHDLYELYTKRDFRCDCGNSKFSRTECKLHPAKDSENEKNKYNQNFTGTYCSCSRPYPDPEDEIEDVMFQCAMCEDWYHGRHLSTDLPDNYEEVICTDCMGKHPFLWAYQVSSPVTTVQNESAGEEKIDIGGGEDGMIIKLENCESIKQNTSASEPEKQEPGTQQSDKQMLVMQMKIDDSESIVIKREQTDSESEQQESLEEEADPVTGTKRKMDSSTLDCAGASGSGPSVSSKSESSAKWAKREEGGTSQDDSESKKMCIYQDLKTRNFTTKDCAAFWQAGWREKLCSCAACLSMYKEEGVSFLLDTSDTVSSYEEKGRSSGQGLSELEQEQTILAGMNRYQQVEMLNGFNDLKTQLSGFLKTFADSGKVVKPEDISGFFAHMERRKKDKMSAIPHFCK